MSIYPPITLTFLNGFLLLIPMLVLRFALPALVRRESLAALDHFPPVVGRERLAMKMYFVTNTFLIFSPLLARLTVRPPWWAAGWVCYLAGLFILGVSFHAFSAAPPGKLVRTGPYRYSRNPIYIGIFLVFIGAAFLTGSWFHLLLTLVYQIAVHQLILSEERWCQATFGDEFTQYRRTVGRYL